MHRTRGSERTGLASTRVWLLLGSAFALIAVAAVALMARPASGDAPATWGVTFSIKQCEALGIDWRAAYRAVVREMRPGGLRLIAYWDRVEPRQGVFDFRELDEQMHGAETARIPVVLAVGEKAPRWPEYHAPAWTARLSPVARQAASDAYLREVVRRYRGSPALRYWQVENEPFFAFGRGRPVGRERLAHEVAVVRDADGRRRVLLTDSGEYGAWWRVAPMGDALGVTMYRRVYNPRVGAVEMPLQPWFYRLKARYTRRVTGRPAEPFVCIELAAEPWARLPTQRLPAAEQTAAFSPDDFDDTMAYARATGFSAFYLWGAEWWYARAQRGDRRYWDKAVSLMRSGAPR